MEKFKEMAWETPEVQNITKELKDAQEVVNRLKAERYHVINESAFRMYNAEKKERKRCLQQVKQKREEQELSKIKMLSIARKKEIEGLSAIQNGKKDTKDALKLS
jgi:hypothetical protein